MKEKYYLGLDIGTNSVGWAVTDEEYTLSTFNKKDMWGIRLFEDANTAADRRVKRANRRRLQRRKQRINLLQELFAEEIASIDETFFQRLNESRLHLEDKTVNQLHTVFAGKDYTDIEYYKQYPTIFHLRKELIEEKSYHDPRLVYLAIHHILKNRGHFLLDGDIEAVSDFEKTYDALVEVIRNELNFELTCDDTNEIKTILQDKNASKSVKARRLEGIFSLTDIQNNEDDELEPSTDKKILKNILSNLCKFIVGNKGDISKLTNNNEDFEQMDKKSFSFADSGYEDVRNSLEETASQWCYMIDTIKAMHDWSILVNILKGEKYISVAKVAQYEQHKDNLEKLRRFILKYGSKSLYKEVFNDRKKSTNYCAYIGSVKVNGKKYSVKKCTQEDFYKYLKKTLEALKDNVSEEDISLYEHLIQGAETENLLPLQISKENGVVPHQVHKAELEKILDNAGEYLTFLNEKDENGLSVRDKIMALLTFRIPYYVGPLSDRHKNDGSNSWIARKAEGYIYPWNFDEMVDLEESNEAFIKRMTNKCTYLVGEDVLPKNSLLYSRYMVLNELNNLRIYGNKVSNELKKQIYENLFKRHTRVTGKRLLDYLNANGYDVKKEDLSGFDQDFKASLSSYLDFEKKVFGERIDEFKVQQIAEDIIKWKTIYGDDKKMIKSVIEKNYPGEFNDTQLKNIQGLRYSGWGNFSKKFLTGIEGMNLETGEVSTIIDALWNSDENYNLLQLLSSNFTYRKQIEEHNTQVEKEIDKINYDALIKDMYVSPANKRAIWQTVQIAEEVKKVMGKAPEKILVEMARGANEDQKNTRTTSRKDQLIKLYEACEEDVRQWTEEISKHDERDFRSMKLYLYYTQQGRCMYTGDPIDIDDLMRGNSKWDRDHIYPQSKIKDDSIDNLVLVNREVNARKSADVLSSDIQHKMKPFWKNLLEKGFISKKKYDRLTRTSEFTDEELSGFISRQLVETRQSTKAVAELLNKIYGKDGTEIVYVKAGLVSQFRKNDLGMLKSRRINDYHHARDAYLNIVVGNVYNARFTSNPVRWIKENRNTDYSINAVFRHDVNRGKQCVWTAKRKGEPGTIDNVRSMMKRNTILHTEYTYCDKGELFNASLEKKGGTGSIRIKKDLPIEKYGGYKSANTSYFAHVEFEDKKGNRVRNILGVPMYVDNILKYDDNALLNYFENVKGLKNVKILREKIKKNSLLVVDGFPMRIRGENEITTQLKNDVQLILSMEQAEIIRRIEKYLEKNKENEAIEKFDKISDRALIELYDVFIDKLDNSIYKKRPANQIDNLRKGREKFTELTLREKSIVLNEILTMFRCDINTKANLSNIGGSANAGNMAISKNTLGRSRLILVNQSVTGLFENKKEL